MNDQLKCTRKNDKNERCKNLESDLEMFMNKDRRRRDKKEKKMPSQSDSKIDKQSDSISNSIIKNTAFMKNYFAPPGVNYDEMSKKNALPNFSKRNKRVGRFQNIGGGNGAFSVVNDHDINEDVRKSLKMAYPIDGDNSTDPSKSRFSSADGSSPDKTSDNPENCRFAN